MYDEYYNWDDENFTNIEALSSIHEMTCRGLQLGVSSTLWEWMAGSGRLSATARTNEVTHLPPLDYRWGINLGHWYHQLIVLWYLLLFPVDVLFASPTCTPWGSNARQWTTEERTRQRTQESLTLQFLAVVFLVQMLLGRAWMLEQPAGSDMFRASAMNVLIGNEGLDKTYSHVFDQCMLGAQSEGTPVKKHTGLTSNRPFHSSPPQCDGSHQHCVLRGSDGGGSRTAQAAVYPQPMCDLLISEMQAISDEIRSEGRAAEIHVQRLRDPQHHGHTLQNILPELRLLAEHRGQEFVDIFDAIVVPWARTALGAELSKLRYDENLSNMHIVSLPEVHKKVGLETWCRSVQHVGRGPAATDGVPEILEKIKKDLEDIKANMINNISSAVNATLYGDHQDHAAQQHLQRERGRNLFQ